MYGDGDKAPFQQINAKLHTYRMQRQKIKDRADFHSEIQIYIQQFETFSAKVDCVFTMPKLTDK